MTQARAVQVDDQLERRIRKPVDALLCLLCVAAIVLVIALALAAGATTAGVETDIVGASKRLPESVLHVAPPIALFALFILPAALAVSQLVRRQLRRLIEAAATGLAAAAAADIVNRALIHPEAARLYYAVIMSRPGGTRVVVDALDPYLTALVAYITMIGLTGRQGWRNALVVIVGGYAIVELATARTTGLPIVLTLLAGRAIGLAVRYGAGSASERPSALAIAAALTSGDLKVEAIRRVRQGRPGTAGSRYYEVTTADAGQLDVVVFDRDQQAAGSFYQFYRWIRVAGQVSQSAPLSVDRTVERRALLSYATQDAGVPTPRLRALVHVGPDAALLAYEHCAGSTLAQKSAESTDEELGRVWDAVDRLHARHVTHRGLTADRILFLDDAYPPGGQPPQTPPTYSGGYPPGGQLPQAPPTYSGGYPTGGQPPQTPPKQRHGEVMLLDPGDGDIAASDLQQRLDVAQLIAELALYVGPERSAKLAVEKIDSSELVAVLSLLQPVALVRSTRHELRRRRDVLPTARKTLLAAVPGGEEVPAVQLGRIRPRTLVTLVASVVAAYLLAGELAQASLSKSLHPSDWRWAGVALALSAVTYVGAALTVTGFVTERLGLVRTLLVQLASSFVTLVTPAAVGGVALNIRYLQRRKIPSPVAVTSVAVSQVSAFALHILLLATFGAIAGTGDSASFRPPVWAYFVVGGLVLLAGAMLAVPAGRRMVRARLVPTFNQVMPRLIEVAQHPRKLAEGFGGALLLSFAYIAALSACVAAFGGSAPIARIAVVYLTGSALGSIIPTPGGLGAVETALTVGLTAAGVPGAVAVSAVLLFRLVTFWLPVPVGWAALSYLERRHVL